MRVCFEQVEVEIRVVMKAESVVQVRWWGEWDHHLKLVFCLGVPVRAKCKYTISVWDELRMANLPDSAPHVTLGGGKFPRVLNLCLPGRPSSMIELDMSLT